MPCLASNLAEHGRVLVRHRGAELGEHASRQIEAGGDGIEVARAGAGAGADEHLVRLAGGHDLIHQRINGRAPAIDDALAADLDDAGLGEDAEIRRGLRRRLKLRIGQRPFHEKRFELRCGVGHDVPFC